MVQLGPFALKIASCFARNRRIDLRLVMELPSLSNLDKEN